MPVKRSLLPEHEALLRASAISDEVAAARGYFTATSGAELGRLGFAAYQRQVPTLVIPSWGVTGEIVNYQHRPDRPRVDRERGREIKYETVAGSHVHLDIPPACRPHLGSTRSPLHATEGLRKVDSLASAGVCAVGLLGVDCFQCADWDRIALEGRHVFVTYDNDVIRNPSVHGALDRFAALLTSKGAIVHYVYLPNDEGKIGVDDYLAAGHTVSELYGLAEDELRPLPAEPRQHRPAAWPTMWLLDSVERLLGRFVRFPSEHEAAALSLYVLHTHALAAARATPYILVVSPEKRAGKTRVLEVIELLVREPLRAASITAAGVYQSIEAWTPTLLVDEVDAIFRVRSDQNEALRGVLDAGNRRGSYVVRGTQDGGPAKFGTWSAKVLAGINTGRLPDTIRDRAVVLGMERLADGEAVDDLFPDDDDIAGPAEQLRGRLAGWAEENHEALAAWRRSERLRALDTRLQEAWDPLLAIADLAGGNWPQRAKDAAIALATSTVDPSEGEHGHLLLHELRGIYGRKGSPLATKDICRELNDLEELPFTGYHEGGGIQPRDVAKLVKPYGVRSKQVWVDSHNVRGYEREQFGEAWKRYAPESGGEGGDEGDEGGDEGAEEHARTRDPSTQTLGPLGPLDPASEQGFHPLDETLGERSQTLGRPSLADSGPVLADGLADEIPDEQGGLADLADLAHENGHPASRMPPNGRPDDADARHRAERERLRRRFTEGWNS